MVQTLATSTDWDTDTTSTGHTESRSCSKILFCYVTKQNKTKKKTKGNTSQELLPTTCLEFLLLFKHTPYSELILSFESPTGNHQLPLPLAFLCSFLLLLLPLLLGQLVLLPLQFILLFLLLELIPQQLPLQFPGIQHILYVGVSEQRWGGLRAITLRLRSCEKVPVAHGKFVPPPPSPSDSLLLHQAGKELGNEESKAEGISSLLFQKEKSG